MERQRPGEREERGGGGVQREKRWTRSRGDGLWKREGSREEEVRERRDKSVLSELQQSEKVCVCILTRGSISLARLSASL